MANNWFFFSQREEKKSQWDLAFAAERERIVADVQPQFITVLDLSHVAEDNDWSKVRYRGPFYADFDAGDDLLLVCEQFRAFLAKLDVELGFDLSQARFYASGGKGFHAEVPQECFLPKLPAAGTAWLPYVYRAMAESLIVDTLDLRVYSGKRGRMWRTPNVKRENGYYKVPLTLDEVLTITPDEYRELIKAPRQVPAPTPPSCNSRFAMLFSASHDKVVANMRGRKKRLEKSNALLDPWKRAGRHPPSIEMIMRGENIADGAGFQQIAMQLAIYATSVGLPLDEFLARCQGLCENHVSDSARYNTLDRRRAELSHMYEYLQDNTLYEFDTAPVARLVRPGVPVADLGVMDTEDREDQPTASPSTTDVADGDAPAAEPGATVDLALRVRRGFFMNGEGMWRKQGDTVDCVCRAVLRNVEGFSALESGEFRGYEFDIVVPGRPTRRVMLAAENFTSAAALKKFFVSQQCSFQGGDVEASALYDIIVEKAMRNGQVRTYPREGFFIYENPDESGRHPVKIYLTQDTYLASVAPDDERYFRLRYRPERTSVAFHIDIHRAPELGEQHRAGLHDMFHLNRPETVAKLLGWFVAAHYRSVYLHLFHKFPLLQIYGEAGSGKSHIVMLLARLHWYRNPVPLTSASGFTRFALDAYAASSTSAPLILDEYKPREMRARRGVYENVKDVLKANYIAANIGQRGSIDRLHDTGGVEKSRATAPIVFMGEAIEMETALFERCVMVNLSKAYLTSEREKAYERLGADPEPLSALGRMIVEMGFALDLEQVRAEVQQIQETIRARLGDLDDTQRSLAPRLIYNQAIVVHGLRVLRQVLARCYGTEFDDEIDALLGTREAGASGEDAKVIEMHGMSEISKVMNRIALLSRDTDLPHEMRLGKDYLVGDGWVEIKVERAYDQYRRFCASINDDPLFDTLDAFGHALNSYSPVTDRFCASSELRRDDSSERVVRLDLRKLNREGVQQFRQ